MVQLHGGHAVETLSQRLGHSTSAITKAIYVHPVQELDQEMADAGAEFILGIQGHELDGPSD